jgi:hypothetical protein
MPGWLALGLAAALGVAAVWLSFPAGFLIPRAGAGWAPIGDAAQHAIAQRYFITGAWAWPPLLIPTLGEPAGTHLAFADGIPLLALKLRLLRAWLPPGFHGIGLWYAIATLAQPVAAAWALQGAGERRMLPGIGIALAALAMPAWLARYGHAALTGHFLLWLALGVYLRLVRPAPRWWVAAALLAVAALLVHPYLAAMVLAVLGAAPITLLLRGDRAFLGAATGGLATLAAVGATMAALGYLGGQGDGGYGQFAMNLASPAWPHRSALLAGLVTTDIDATGKGGWEGYNWLGMGLWLGLLAALVLAPRGLADGLRRHAGLALMLAALTALALSHRVGFGTRIVLDFGAAPALLEPFRGSGRFFWPVGYALLLGACVLLARRAPLLVLGLGLVQAADSVAIRADLAAWAASRPPWVLDGPALRGLMADASRLTLLPPWPCIAPGDTATFNQAHQALALASETALPTSTMHLARWHRPPACTLEAEAAAPFAPGELRLVLPAAQPIALPLVPDAAARCRPVGIAIACR